MSFEALVLRQPWSQLFTQQELTVARRNINLLGGGILPEEAKLSEGAKTQISVNRYERDAKAREQCIEFYGTACSVCKVELAAVYGDLAKGFIHVHHIVSLSSIAENHDVNPELDLRPVCPNCHAIIHLGGKTRSIEEVKQLLRNEK